MKKLYKENPDIIEQMKETQRKKHKNNKEFRENFMDRMNKFYNSSEGKLKAKKQGKSLKKTYKNNPDLAKNISIKNSKTYKIKDKNDNVIIITNLCKFCKENNLSKSSMNKVAHGKMKHHRGYSTIY